jgi:hypothetical protein
MVVSKFINTGMIYFILYTVNNSVDILSENGLVNKIAKLFSLGAFIDITLNLLLPESTIRNIYYSYVYKNVSYANKPQ